MPTTTQNLIGQSFTRHGAQFRVMREYLPGMYECRSARGEIVIPVEEIENYLASDMPEAR